MALFNRPVPLFYNPGLVLMLCMFAALTYLFKTWLDSTVGVTVNSYVLFYGASTAVIGWLVGAMINANNARRQHTVNVLLGMQYSEVHRSHVDEFMKGYPSDSKIKHDDITKKDKKSAIDAARYLLNHLEFIAAGIKTRDLSHKLLKNTLRGHLCVVYNKSEEFVKYARGDNGEGEPANSLTYEHLIRLTELWKRKKPSWGAVLLNDN